MKILNCFLENRPGGANLRGYRIALRLREQGIETRFLFNEKQADTLPFSDFECDLYRYLQIGQAPNRMVSSLVFLLLFPFHLIRMIRTIRGGRFGLVHVNGMMNVLPALAAVLTRTRLLWHLNDTSTPRWLVPLLRRLVRRWSWRIGLSAKKLGDYYFGNDPIARRKFVVLYPPVETETWRPEAVDSDTLEQFRRRFDLLGKGPVITAVGNLNPAKGYEYFIEMARVLRQRFPSAVFVVAGARLDSRKKYAESIDRQIREHNLSDVFRFLGYWPDVRVVLLASDVFVMSSVREAGPTVVLEAMAMRRPIVATDVGGVREEIQDGSSGVIVPSRSGEALAEGVQRVLTMTPEQSRQMTAAARDHVERSFDIRQILQVYLRLFQNETNLPLQENG